MSDEYTRELLRVAVAQICQTIGYNATQSTPLELLQDATHKFLNEFSRDMRRQVEHYNRTEPNLNDACLTLKSLNINPNELLDYINNVEPVPFAVDVPKFPAHKDSNLNFLKPGSKEVLTRPVHMYEHLPPTLPVEPGEEPLAGGSHYMLNGSSQDKTGLSGFIFDTVGGEVAVSNIDGVTGNINRNSDIPLAPPFMKGSSSATHLLDEEGRPTREISSVVMTTGGFISPAIEGKLPDATIPDLIAKYLGFDAPPPPPPPPPPRPEITHAAENEISITARAKVNTEADHESSISKTLENVDSKKKPNPAEISSTSGGGAISASTSTFEHAEVTSTGGNLTGKKTTPFQYSAIQHAPTIASKLLKKAKKKTSTSPFPTLQGKFNRSDFPGNIGGINHSNMHYDKAQRKSMKMLQKKISKSTKAVGGGSDTMELNRSDDMFKGLVNLPALTAMPPATDRLQMEKLMKKQAKQKQKQMKNQFKNLADNQRSIPPPENILPNKILTSITSGLVRDTKISQTSKDIGNQSFSMSPPKSTSHSVTSSRRNLLDSMPIPIRGVKSSANMFTNMQLINDIMEGSQNTADPNEKKTAFDVKLSTEPDRSKLNIFKKISKQKGKVSPNTTKTQTPPVYTSNENKIINLPSGTTITPALPSMVGSRHVYPPDASDIVPAYTLSDKLANESMGLGGKQGSHAMPSVPPNISLFGATGEHIEANPSFILNKPKKRGRKPGSKNQAKVPGNNGSPSTPSPIKKAKKMKMAKNMYGMYGNNLPPVPSHLNAEPLNLTSSNQFGSKFPMNFQRTFPAMGQAIMHPQIKERKDRKKIKMKNPPVATVTSSSEQTNCLKPNVNVPTKEEVHSINKKLMRMDTVLKPAPAGPSLSLVSPDGSKNVADPSKIISPTKSSGSKKHAQPRTNIMPPGMAPLFSLPTTRPLFPMMPMYAFQPRPGLIPTPGLFPTPAPGLFQNNSKNIAPNMLMPSFLNFPPKAPAIGISGDLDLDNIDKNNEATPQAGDRSYCNVASFVPESMKLTSPQPKADRQTSDCESYPLTPKFCRSPTLSEVASDLFCKQLGNFSTPDSSSVNSKSIPATPGGGISLSNFEVASTLENISSQIPENTQSFKNNIFIPNTLGKSNIARNVQQSQTAVNADDPIEVSDDSGDTPSKPLSPILHATKSKVNQSFVKPSPTASISLSNIDDIFTPIRDMRTMGNETATRDTKKLKKSNKFAKKNVLPGPKILPIDMFAAEKGGKLAGGADLIPLAATGLAYSSKTIPSTSLTASATPRFPIHRSEFNLFSNLTHTPNILTAADLLMKHKEHKKMKKLKDGKIKKKKDKKDKTKNRERNEKYLHKTEKLNKETEKDLLKKLKKEKKKEKQRMDSFADPTVLNMTNQSFPSQSLFDAATADNLRTTPSITSSSSNTSIPPASTSSSTTAVASSLVPKLTLKLGNCQSPTPTDDSAAQKLTQIPTVSTTDEREKREPSPELARISPLVTRPPKQKIGLGDASTLHSVALNAASTSINNSNSEYLIDNSKANVPSNLVTPTHLSIPPPSPWLSEGTLSASSVLLPQQLLKTTKTHEHQFPSTSTAITHSTDASASATAVSLVRPTVDTQSPVPLISEANRPSSYIDAEGNRVWICPACGKVDDGSAMIGCDGCDAWYHWVCVGIFVAPKDNEDWFCRVCITRKKGIHGTDKKRKRNKKK